MIKSHRLGVSVCFKKRVQVKALWHLAPREDHVIPPKKLSTSVIALISSLDLIPLIVKK